MNLFISLIIYISIVVIICNLLINVIVFIVETFQFGVYFLLLLFVALLIYIVHIYSEHKFMVKEIKKDIENAPGKEYTNQNDILEDLGIPVRKYEFDEEEFGKYKFGFKKTGDYEYAFRRKNITFFENMFFRINMPKVLQDTYTKESIPSFYTILDKHNQIISELEETMLALKLKSDKILEIKDVENIDEYLNRLKSNYEIYLTLKILEKNLYDKTMTRIKLKLLETKEFVELRNIIKNLFHIYSTEKLYNIDTIDCNPSFEIDSIPIMLGENGSIQRPGSIIIFNGLLFLVNKDSKYITSIMSIDNLVVDYGNYEEIKITEIDRHRYPKYLEDYDLSKFAIKRIKSKTYYDHENKDGSKDLRFKENDLHFEKIYLIGVYWLIIQVLNVTIKVPFPTKKESMAVKKLFDKIKLQSKKYTYVSEDNIFTIRQKEK